jgi:hypothetical protein
VLLSGCVAVSESSDSSSTTLVFSVLRGRTSVRVLSSFQLMGWSAAFNSHSVRDKG